MSRTTPIFLFGIVLAAMVSFGVPQAAYATACPGPCGIGQSCDESTRKCVNPTTPVSGDPTPSSQTSGGNTFLVNPFNNINSLPDLLHAIIGALVKIGTVVLTLALIWVGALFILAQGNPEGIKKAKQAFLWTAIGGLIVLGAQAISVVIQTTVSNIGG